MHAGGVGWLVVDIVCRRNAAIHRFAEISVVTGREHAHQAVRRRRMMPESPEARPGHLSFGGEVAGFMEGLGRPLPVRGRRQTETPIPTHPPHRPPRPPPPPPPTPQPPPPPPTP